MCLVADLYGKVGVCVTVGRNTENSVVAMFVENVSSLELTDINSNDKREEHISRC